MKVYAVVEIYGSIFQGVEIFDTSEAAMDVINAKRMEMGDELDPDCTDDSAISLNMEEEWRFQECEVRKSRRKASRTKKKGKASK